MMQPATSPFATLLIQAASETFLHFKDPRTKRGSIRERDTRRESETITRENKREQKQKTKNKTKESKKERKKERKLVQGEKKST
jgi:hypothetical protein